MQKLLLLIARPLIGTGIGQKLPLIHAAFKWLYHKSSSKTFKIDLAGISLTMQGNDSGPGLYLASRGEYEPFQTTVFSSVIKKDNVVFDIGAHVGYYSLVASKLIGPQGKVIAFEPSEENTYLLTKNKDDNKAKNISIQKLAVSDKDSKIKFYLSQTSSGDNSIKKTKFAREVTVTSTTLDSFCKQNQISPDVIKIDVEGGEHKVLKGGLKAIKTSGSIFIELRPLTFKKAISILEKLGFKLQLIDEQSRKLYPYSRQNIGSYFRTHDYVNIFGQKNL